MNENVWGFGPERHLSVDEKLDLLQTALLERVLKELSELKSQGAKAMAAIDTLTTDVSDLEAAQVASNNAIVQELQAISDAIGRLATTSGNSALDAQLGSLGTRVSAVIGAMQKNTAALQGETTVLGETGTVATSIGLTADASPVEGTAFNVTAQLLDASGNPSLHAGDAITLTWDGGASDAVSTDASGKAVFPLTLAAGSYTIAAHDDAGLVGSVAVTVGGAP